MYVQRPTLAFEPSFLEALLDERKNILEWVYLFRDT